jgi:hypothetical protein
LRQAVGRGRSRAFYFIADGRRVHKTVHHFLLEYVAGELCTDDHEVADVEWVPLDSLADRLAYPDERGLAQRAKVLVAQVVAAGIEERRLGGG